MLLFATSLGLCEEIDIGDGCYDSAACDVTVVGTCGTTVASRWRVRGALCVLPLGCCQINKNMSHLQGCETTAWSMGDYNDDRLRGAGELFAGAMCHNFNVTATSGSYAV
jgi:hypothetical protein